MEWSEDPRASNLSAAEIRSKADAFVEFAQLRQRLTDFDSYFTGSYALDTMAWADVDINVLFTGNHEGVFELGSQLLNELIPSWFELRYAAAEPNSPGIYFLGFEATYQSTLWNVDIWFQDHSAFHTNREWLASMNGILNEELRAAIVAIKQSLLSEGVYGTSVASLDIYEATIAGGVRNVPDFKTWLSSTTR